MSKGNTSKQRNQKIHLIILKIPYWKYNPVNVKIKWILHLSPFYFLKLVEFWFCTKLCFLLVDIGITLHVDQSNKSEEFIDLGDYFIRMFPPFNRTSKSLIKNLQEGAGKRQARSGISWVLSIHRKCLQLCNWINDI